MLRDERADRLARGFDSAADIDERRRLELGLPRQQSGLDALFELMPAMILIKDADDRVLRANRRLAAYVGKSVDEIEGKTASEVFAAFEAGRHASDAEVIRSRKPELGIIESIRRPDGHVQWIQTDKVPYFDDDGRAIGVVVVSQDITERRRTESRYRRLVDSGIQGVIFWNTKGEITDANDYFLRLVRYSREELECGLVNWKSMTPSEHTRLDERALKELAANGVCTTFEKEWIRKDGTRVPVLLGAALFEDNPDEGVCFALDLTDRVKSEALRVTERRFRALFEQGAVGVARVDAGTGRYLEVNRRFGEILGRSSEEMTQLTAADVTHPQTVERDLELVRQMTAGAIGEFAVEKRYLHKDGTDVWVNVTVSETWSPGDTPDFYLAIVNDITAHKRLEDQLRQAQKMEALGTLAGGIAHDFNNIVASINGYAELAKLKLSGNPEVRDYLGAVLTAGHRAVALVRQILAFSRQEQPERTLVSLGPIVTESIKLLRSTVPLTTELVASLAADVPAVLADATQINQVLMNLGINAWHAIKDSPGRIEFGLEPFIVDAALAAAQPGLRPGSYARVSVNDTGCGMSQALLRRIFEPFFTTKAPGEGTGLGLAVVHGIMDRHDGAVTVHSQIGEGTSFCLYFPAYTGAGNTCAGAHH